MTVRKTRHTQWLLIALCLISVLLIGKGCKRDSNNSVPTSPVPNAPALSLKLADHSELQSKSIGLTIEAVGLDQNSNPTNDVAESISIPNPTFPLDVDLTVFTPPCRWRMTITVNLSRDPARQKSIEFDACEVSAVNLNVDTFEEMQLPDTEGPIYAPASVNAGDPIEVRCGPLDISAPDSSPVAVLQEQGGQSTSGPIGANASVSKSFPDPYPVALPSSERRIFTCTISDKLSPSKSFQQVVQRILPTTTTTPTTTPTTTQTPTPIPTTTQTPTPTPTTTQTPTPTPTTTQTPTPTPTTTQTPTPTPTPDPCQVQNENDNGSGSLRQLLADAQGLGCSTITFDAGVSTIPLTSGELTVPATTLTIDGNVIVSGSNNSRVFYVNSGTDVTFQNLTIRDGDATTGGGIYNDGGTVTIADGTTISNNTGGGIFNDMGTITINGTIRNNSIVGGGGGIYNSGTIIINGTIGPNNYASGDGGGIYNIAPGDIILNSGSQVISNNGTSGGGIWTMNSGASVTIANGAIVDLNVSTMSGGGIFNRGGTINVNGTIGPDNTAGDTGGGVYNEATYTGTPNYGCGIPPCNTPNDCDGPGGCP